MENRIKECQLDLFAENPGEFKFNPEPAQKIAPIKAPAPSQRKRREPPTPITAMVRHAGYCLSDFN
jgi:hypothetical protein